MRASDPTSEPVPLRTWRESRLAEGSLAILVSLLVTVVALRPTPARFLGAIAPDLGDPVFNLVVLKWVDHATEAGFAGFSSPGFLFPEREVLLYSDHLIGPGLIFSALRSLGVGAIGAYNSLLLGSFVLGFLATFAVGRRIGLSIGGALIAGAVFAIAPVRLANLSHLQLLWAPWLPLLLWTWHRFWTRPGPSTALAAGLLYLLHVTGGLYLAYMAHLALAVLAIAALARWRSAPPRPREIAWMGLSLFACALVASAVFLPYLGAARSGLRRWNSEIESYAATLVSFVQPSGFNAYAPESLRAWARPENDLFPGLLGTVFAGLALLRCRRSAVASAEPRRRWILLLGLLATASGLALGDAKAWSGAREISIAGLAVSLRSYSPAFWLLALGVPTALSVLLPRIQLETGRDEPARRFWKPLLVATLVSALACLPAVYLTLARWIPGMTGMRVPPRFFFVALPGLAWLAGRGWDRMWASTDRLRSRVAITALAVGLLAGDIALRPIPWRPLEEEEAFPAVYSWIGADPRIRSYVELPLADRSRAHEETLPMYHATLHWKPILNGYSGYLPLSYLRRADTLRPLPDSRAIAQLRKLGVSAMVVRRRDVLHGFGRRGYRAWIETWRSAGVERIFHDSSHDVFLLGAGGASRSLPPG